MHVPTTIPPSIGHKYDSYVAALEDGIAKQLVDYEDAFTVTITATHSPLLAEIMAELKKEMTAMMATFNTATPTGGGNRDDSGSGHNRRQKIAYGKNANGKDLPTCSHCNKLAMHKPNNCFSLPKNAEKMKTANFIDGKFVKKGQMTSAGAQ